MAQYEKLADIYDYLVSSVNYEEWLDYIEQILNHYGKQAHTVVDLACGTGNTVLPFARRGYRVTGVDLAGEMLAKARGKAAQAGLEAEFLLQDMCALELPGPVDLVTCYHDGLNYLTKQEDVSRVFQRVYRYLNPGGLFIFDLVNVRKLARTDGSTTFLDEDKLSLVWETSYDADDIWEIRLTCFVRRDGLEPGNCLESGNGRESGNGMETGNGLEPAKSLYEKFHEVHREKAHSREAVEKIVRQEGFQLLAVLHSYSLEPAGDQTYRYFFVAEKPQV